MRAILILIFLLFTVEVWSQKISLKDIQTISKLTTDEAAEMLLSKGFTLRHVSMGKPFDYKSFEFKKGEASMSFDFSDDEDGTREIRSCFNRMLDNDFKTLEGQIKSRLKRTRFFFSKDYNSYFNEYALGAKFLYLNRGICWDDKTKFKQGTFIVLDKRMD